MKKLAIVLLLSGCVTPAYSPVYAPPPMQPVQLDPNMFMSNTVYAAPGQGRVCPNGLIVYSPMSC